MCSSIGLPPSRRRWTSATAPDKLTGVVYFPTAQVNVSNFGAAYTVMIFGNGNFSNTTSADPFNDAVPTGTTFVGKALLGNSTRTVRTLKGSLPKK